MQYKGEELLRLIPQRNPMVMVDELLTISPRAAQTTLHVRPDNMFVYENGELAETGLIEHVAQSASALAGYQWAQEGGTGAPPVGIIGEVKHFDCTRRPCTGDSIHTAITFGLTFANVSIVNGISTVNGEVVAKTQLKIFLQ